jgi:hypothetical protein
MSPERTKWMLRLGLPIAWLCIALFCGLDVVKALGVVTATAFIIAIVGWGPLLGILFLPILLLYLPSAETELKHPDTHLFLFLGVPVSLLIAGLIALSFRAV